MLLRRLLLILMLLLAQLGSNVHALEHLKGSPDEYHLPGQTCLVCLMANDLSSGLTPSFPTLAFAGLGHALIPEAHFFSAQTSAPSPKQQAPPLS